MDHRKVAWIAVSALLLAGAGCARERAAAGLDGAAVQYSVALTAATVSGLPQCTSELAGAAALVDSRPALWTCAAGQWKEIGCTNHAFGTVSQASGATSWACIAGRWTLIDVPPAPPVASIAPAPSKA